MGKKRLFLQKMFIIESSTTAIVNKLRKVCISLISDVAGFPATRQLRDENCTYL